MHGQALTARAAADQSAVEGEVGAQAGDLLVAVAQALLQVVGGHLANLLGPLEHGDALAQGVDVGAQHLVLRILDRDQRAVTDAPADAAGDGQRHGPQQGRKHEQSAHARRLVRADHQLRDGWDADHGDMPLGGTARGGRRQEAAL